MFFPLATALLLLLPQLVRSQSQSFSWGFTTIGDNTTLPECATLPLGVDLTPKGTNPVGKAPFYLIAYPPGGIPVVSSIGSDVKSLSWTVPFAAGTQLVIQLADVNGNSGGLDIPVYTVTAGTSSSCHSAAATTSPVTISTTATHLTTCDPLVLDIAGGAPPYTVTVAANNGLHAYNTTMGVQDNRFTWIDRAIPSDSKLLLATAVDSTGTYAACTSFITVSGPDDTTCPGKSDSSSQTPKSGGTSTTTTTGTVTGTGSTVTQTTGRKTGGTSTNTSAASNGGGSKSSSNTGIIAGATVGGVVLLALAGLLLYFLNRDRRRKDPKADWTGYSDKPDLDGPTLPNVTPYTAGHYQAGGVPGSPPNVHTPYSDHSSYGYPAAGGANYANAQRDSGGFNPYNPAIAAGAIGGGAAAAGAQHYNSSSRLQDDPNHSPQQDAYTASGSDSSRNRENYGHLGNLSIANPGPNQPTSPSWGTSIPLGAGESLTRKSPSSGNLNRRATGAAAAAAAAHEPVLQHQDGGPVRAPSSVGGQSEIPPAYGDIRSGGEAL